VSTSGAMSWRSTTGGGPELVRQGDPAVRGGGGGGGAGEFTRSGERDGPHALTPYRVLTPCPPLPSGEGARGIRVLFSGVPEPAP